MTVQDAFVTPLLRLCNAFKFKIPRFYRACNGVTAPVYVPVSVSLSALVRLPLNPQPSTLNLFPWHPLCSPLSHEIEN